jgi:hypothetical protein
MFEIFGKYYVLDLDKLNKYIFESQFTKNSETELVEVYEMSKEDEDEEKELMLTNKSIRDVKTKGNIQIDNIKYDLVKTFIEEFFETPSTVTQESATFGFIIAFNTLLNQGILTEVQYNA